MNYELEDLSERQENLLDTSIFLGKLLLLGVPFQLFLVLEPDTTSIQIFHAELVNSILVFLGHNSNNFGLDILLNGQTYRITQDCLGWKSMAAFTALIISSGKKIRKNFHLIFVGISIVFVANIFRIITTILLSNSGIISYSIIHGILWKWGLTVLVIVLWILTLSRRKDN